MVLLAPTVHERIARCGTSIPLSGLVAGASVIVDVGGTLHTFVATGGGHHLPVPSLTAGDVVRVRQDDGGGPTPWSAAVEVEDAAVPPTAAPLLPSQVGACSQCVRVDGLVPGSDIRLAYDGALVGDGTANRHGSACVGVKLRAVKEGASITTEMSVCGSIGPAASTPVVPDAALGPPWVGEPIFGCQSVVPLSGLRRGAKTRVETDTGTYLGSICNCWDTVNVNVLHALVPDEQVHAQQYWDGDTCSDDGPWGNWRRVEHPDERIKPVVEAPLIDGDQVIRVTNQIPGADLVVLIRPDSTMAETRFGPRPASTELEISLNAPLSAGQQLAVEQQLCGRVRDIRLAHCSAAASEGVGTVGAVSALRMRGRRPGRWATSGSDRTGLLRRLPLWFGVDRIGLEHHCPGLVTGCRREGHGPAMGRRRSRTRI